MQKDSEKSSKSGLETTEDHLFKGRIRFYQPAIGYRSAIDTVLLAASINAKSGDRVVDMGAGVGVAMLCLGLRVDGVLIDGIEIQPVLADLSLKNINENGFEGRLRVFDGDITNPPEGIKAGEYDFAMANPPFMASGNGNPPPGEIKRTANFEGDADLNQWVKAALGLVRRKGTVVLIQRADRLADIISAILAASDPNGEGAGDIAILPIHPKAGVPANRVIVSFRRAVKAPVTLLEGITVHLDNGGYTPLLERVLDGGAVSLK